MRRGAVVEVDYAIGEGLVERRESRNQKLEVRKRVDRRAPPKRSDGEAE
jgi:hypothetical protein